MKAAVVHPGGKIKYETVDDPTIKNSGDAIIKVTSTATIIFSDTRKKIVSKLF